MMTIKTCFLICSSLGFFTASVSTGAFLYEGVRYPRFLNAGETIHFLPSFAIRESRTDMPFRLLNPKAGFYYLTLEYQDRLYTFIAEFVSFNNLKENWNIHYNTGILTISYHVQTGEVKQAAVSIKEIPPDFIEVLKKEFESRISSPKS